MRATSVLASSRRRRIASSSSLATRSPALSRVPTSATCTSRPAALVASFASSRLTTLPGAQWRGAIRAMSALATSTTEAAAPVPSPAALRSRVASSGGPGQRERDRGGGQQRLRIGNSIRFIPFLTRRVRPRSPLAPHRTVQQRFRLRCQQPHQARQQQQRKHHRDDHAADIDRGESSIDDAPGPGVYGHRQRAERAGQRRGENRAQALVQREADRFLESVRRDSAHRACDRPAGSSD